MVFGTTTFKCDECGNKFVSIAAEWNASAYTAPVQCPKCGGWHTCPASFTKFGDMINRVMYKRIWECQDRQQQD